MRKNEFRRLRHERVSYERTILRLIACPCWQSQRKSQSKFSTTRTFSMFTIKMKLKNESHIRISPNESVLFMRQIKRNEHEYYGEQDQHRKRQTSEK